MSDSFEFLAAEAMEQIHAGAFLMTDPGPNPMTIGWGQFGVVWGRQICTVFVRQSRHSHKLIEAGDKFTVSVPKRGEMKEQLAFCGSKSARDVDKLGALGLKTLPSRTGAPAPLADCAIHFECRIVFKAESDLANLDQPLLDRFYKGLPNASGDPHTIYFGEVIAAYRT